VVSRRDVREAVADALRVALPSAQAVYPYAAADFQQQSPVVRVLSRGAARRPGAPQEQLLLLVEFWVLLAGDGWTPRDAEDTLDALEKELAFWVGANQRQPGGLWLAVDYDGASMVGDGQTVSGEAYLVEMVPLVLTVAR